MKSIPLIIPAHLTNFAQTCGKAYRAPVEIEDYARLTKKLLARAQQEPVVLVADYGVYKELSSVNPGGQKPLAERAGKILFLTHQENLQDIAKEDCRGVDIIDPDAAEKAWVFKVNRAIEAIEFDDEVKDLRAADVRTRRSVDTLNEIGMALSTEKDLDKLLDMIVSNCRAMTQADAGSLYLIEVDPSVPENTADYFADKRMRFQVAQNDSRSIPFKSYVVDISKKSIFGYVGLTQETLNFDDAYNLQTDKEYGWGGREFDASIGYRTMSMLTVPMVNWRGETIGVIQLINRKTDASVVLEDPETCVEFIQPFTEHDVNMAKSIASQASISIQNAQLVNSIKGLFDGFIAASVKAIEARDPTTSGHSQRVAALTVALAEQVDRLDDKRYRDIHFSPEQVQELRYASLLHDFGKIGVRENVLIKAKKLYPEELQSVRDRFELVRRTIALDHTEAMVAKLQKAGAQETDKVLTAARKELDNKLALLDEYLEFILRCNEPTVLAQGGFERLNEISAQEFLNSAGEPVPYLNEKELLSLSVAKGSLNNNDRKEIESHVTHTYQFLAAIPWTGDLKKVAEIAHAHHEKLDGTGYPKGLKADQILIQSKMMTISDIFDALTAWDRPYKKAIPVERALNILVEEANSNHVDPELLEVFIQGELYAEVMQQAPE